MSDEIRLFALSASLFIRDGNKTTTSLIQGWRRCRNEDEARGSFFKVIEDTKPGFAIEQMLCMEIPEIGADDVQA